MRFFTFLTLFIVFLIFGESQAQNMPFVSGMPSGDIMDRLSIRFNAPSDFSTILLPLDRKSSMDFAMSLDSLPLSDRYLQDLQYLANDNNEWLATSEFSARLTGPKEEKHQAISSQDDARYSSSDRSIANIFYKTPANFFEVNKPWFYLRANPMLNFRLGGEQGDDQLLFFNQRGMEVRGAIDDRIFFYTNVVESQTRFPNYLNQRVTANAAIPGNGFYKSYQSTIFDIRNGLDFLNSTAYVGFNVTRHVGVQFGHGRPSIGHGIRSVILSDFSNNYLHLKLNWRVWRFHYQNLFTELASVSTNGKPSGVTLVPKKYMAAHYLNFKVTDNFEVGLMEATVFTRDNGFELQYLNPVILYRSVEGIIGSPDNVLLGLTAKWDIANRLRLYGQLMMDEFKFDELFLERRGWWANKFAMQAGAKYIDAFGVDHLDLQVEGNLARPFTYTHYGEFPQSYSNYNLPLAHPLGANFAEWIATVRYQPSIKWDLGFRFFNMVQGLDPDKDTNLGSNILLDYETRFSEYGNDFLQGVRATTQLGILEASYMIRHNVWLEADVMHRNFDSQNDALDENRWFVNAGIRVNMAKFRMEY